MCLLYTVDIYIPGPLTKIKKGLLFILVITDGFSQLTLVVPLKRIRAYEVVVAFVIEWEIKFGPLRVLVSENGSQVVSVFLQSVWPMLNVENAFTTTYHPRKNRQAERINHSLAAMLLCYVEDHPSDCCE